MPKISNSQQSGNPDYTVKTTVLADEITEIQHVRLDVGTGTSESTVTALNPIPTASIAYTTLIDEVSASVSYYGFALPGTATSAASWKIMKKSVSGAVTTYAFAGSAATFVNVWNNRAALSYG